MHGTFHLLSVGGTGIAYKRWKLTLMTKGPVSSCFRVCAGCISAGWYPETGGKRNKPVLHRVCPTSTTNGQWRPCLSSERPHVERQAVHPCRGLLLWLTEDVAPLYRAAKTCCCHCEIKPVAADFPETKWGGWQEASVTSYSVVMTGMWNYWHFSALRGDRSNSLFHI